MTTENEQKSPWDELVSDLGVELNPQSLERHQPAAHDLPSRTSGKPAREAAPGKPSDWMGLASMLGVEVPAEAEEPATPVTPAAPPAASKSAAGGRQKRPPEVKVECEEEVVEMQDTEIDEEPPEEPAAKSPVTESEERIRISGEAARSAFDALFSPESANWGSAFVAPRTNAESAVPFTEGEDAYFAEDIPETEAEEFDAAEVEGSSQRRSRRRRRGGRGRGKKSESRETVSDKLPAAADVDAVEDDAPTSAEAVSSGDAEDAAPARRRRRRSRGRGRRVGEPIETSDDSDEEELAPALVGAEKDAGDYDEEDEDDDDSSGVGIRTSHRNLPTWTEAVSMIVDSNLEQRSKSPAKPASSSRGRSRGGRRHKKT